MKQLLARWNHLLRAVVQGRQCLSLEYPVDFRPRPWGESGHELLHEILEAGRDEYADWVEKILSYRGEFETWAGVEQAAAGMPGWGNSYLSVFDMASLFTIISERKPGKVIEVGSGNSTKVTNRARSVNSPDTTLISIDPCPRAEIAGLSDRIVNQQLEDCDLEEILSLEAGDVLFVDNSHRILPNSDATVVFLEILPRLREGVLVHFHDIFLPYDYPQRMCDRFYSEQYGLAMHLMSNPSRYRCIFPAMFIASDPALSEPLASLGEMKEVPENERDMSGASFWIEIGKG